MAVQSVVNRFETCARTMEIWLLSSGDERPGHMVEIKAAVMIAGACLPADVTVFWHQWACPGSFLWRFDPT